MSHWQDVLDQQLDLYNFWAGPNGAATAQGFGASMDRVEEEIRGKNRMPELSAQIQESEAIKLHRADPIYVDPDMMTLIESASETFEPEPLQESDLITQHGFVVLPRPLILVDRHGARVSYRAFAWAPIVVQHRIEGSNELVGTEMALHLSLYTHIEDALDGTHDDFPTRQLEPGETPESYRRYHERMGTPYMLCHLTTWEFGTDPADVTVHNDAGNTDIVSYGAKSFWAPIQAFFRLSMQTITDRYKAQPPRAARKRWGRAMRPEHEPYITVIRLRRPKHKHDDSEPGTVEWTHRWISGGHWRNQPYPSLGITRQIYIPQSVKGPEHLPLLVRKGRAFELVR